MSVHLSNPNLPSASGDEREFPMSEQNFRELQQFARELTGISLSDQKQNMIYGRLARRIRALGLRDFDQYCALLGQHDSPETREFINAITTNLTAFFRENHHFEYLKNTWFPELLRSKEKDRRIRMWSAGCSTGEEPYSLAMVVKSIPALQNWDVAACLSVTRKTCTRSVTDLFPSAAPSTGKFAEKSLALPQALR